MFFFFFKQKTAYDMRISDWSSDVCSSDLIKRRRNCAKREHGRRPDIGPHTQPLRIGVKCIKGGPVLFNEDAACRTPGQSLQPQRAGPSEEISDGKSFKAA